MTPLHGELVHTLINHGFSINIFFFGHCTTNTKDNSLFIEEEQVIQSPKDQTLQCSFSAYFLWRGVQTGLNERNAQLKYF